MTILFLSYHRSIKAIVFVMWYFYITYDYNLVFLIKDTILNSYISPTTFLRVSKLKKRKHLICCSLFHTKVFVIFKGILDPFSIFHQSSIFLKQHTTNILGRYIIINANIQIDADVLWWSFGATTLQLIFVWHRKLNWLKCIIRKIVAEKTSKINLRLIIFTWSFCYT